MNRLPSNTNNPGDRVTLLLWYKEDRNTGGGMGSPIYRIDARTNNNDISIGESPRNNKSCNSYA